MLIVSVLLLWLAFFVALAFRRPSSWIPGYLSVGATAGAWGIWSIGLVQRGIGIGHWPMSTRYEFGLAFAWATMALYLLLEAEGLPRPARPWLLLVTAGLTTLLATRPPGEQVATPLPPVLRSLWFPLHTLSSALAYGASGVAAGLALAALRTYEEMLQKTLLHQMGRAAGWSFLWLTAGMLIGALWARDAWGRFWGWDPKETWTLIVWLWYLLFFHLRSRPRWKNRWAALLVLAAFGGVLFLYWGVPWLVRVVRLESLHGF